MYNASRNLKQGRIILIILLLCSFWTIVVQAQQTIPVTGGNATGSTGSVSYSVGQILYNTILGTNGTVAQGVQQPYEISVVTAIENTEGITLEYKVYPNPTKGLITLTINGNFRYRIYDLSGILLQDKKIESGKTEISLESHSFSMYFLKVIKDNQEVKVFKIIKR
jgi:hypothetical protein